MKSLNLFGEGVRGLLSLNLATKKAGWIWCGCKSSKTRHSFQYLPIFINLNLLRV